ncbi:nicotinamide riboside kinase 1 [Xylariaceae sp. FL0594]|nr:nicotinamide riboside kinase 1 [Xylariaceae sp. FL0594]
MRQPKNIKNNKAIIVAISGASSSGKTTLARLLRDVFPGTFILHEDDFYRPEEEIPSKDGLLDWDCEGALNFDEMARALEYIRAEGTFPPFVDSKEDQNSVGACTVSDRVIEAARERVRAWSSASPLSISTSTSSTSTTTASSSNTQARTADEKRERVKICILDGFLLFTPTTSPTSSPTTSTILQRINTSLLDIKLLLTVSRLKATSRRQNRDGYVTLEGFWTDPPGYVDTIVWPNYASSHAWLFEKGDVNRGMLDKDVLEREGICAFPGVLGGGGEGEQKGKEGEGEQRLDVDMETIFNWAVDTLMQKLDEVVIAARNS